MNDHQDQEITSTVTEDEALNIVLSALLYEDGKRRSYTHATRNLIEKYKEVMGKANYKFIEGILDYGIYREPYALFQHAERMGCRHPMLYHFLAKCCCEEDKGTYVDYMKALNYYQQATSLGCMLSCLAIFDVYHCGYRKRYNSDDESEDADNDDYSRNNNYDDDDDDDGSRVGSVGYDQKRAYHYFIELEHQGYVDASLYDKLADHYNTLIYNPHAVDVAKEYYQRAVDMGYGQAYVSLYYQYNSYSPKWKLPHQAASILVEAEEKGLAAKDDRIICRLIEHLLSPYCKVCPTLFEKYQKKNPSELALYFCDLLIQRGEASGYKLKAFLYWRGINDIPKDQAKAVSILEEADKANVASYGIYYKHDSGLIVPYMKGLGVPIDGAKALYYCERALKVVESSYEECDVYRCMSKIYQQGIPPVQVDESKASWYKGMSMQ